MHDEFLGPATGAALAARDRLTGWSAKPAGDERAAAQFAQRAIFTEALLNAVRARFAELRTVAK